MVVKINIRDVFSVDDDVDTVGLNVDVVMVEGGESHVVDTLLHRSDPYHGRVAQTTCIVLVVARVVVEIDRAGLRGLQVA